MWRTAALAFIFLVICLIAATGCDWQDEPLSANHGKRSSWQSTSTTEYAARVEDARTQKEN